MKKSIFSIIFILLLTSILPAAGSETVATRNAKELIQLLITKKNSVDNRVKRKKLKKVVRKAGRMYRTVKPGSDNRKKSRIVQRKARRIINIF